MVQRLNAGTPPSPSPTRTGEVMCHHPGLGAATCAQLGCQRGASEWSKRSRPLQFGGLPGPNAAPWPPPKTAAAPWSYAGGRQHRRKHQPKEVDISSYRKCRRCHRQRPMHKIDRRVRQGRQIRARLADRTARHHFRRLLGTARDELVRTGVKASLSGVGTLALYWWHHR